jgi:hypothetical protein
MRAWLGDVRRGDLAAVQARLQQDPGLLNAWGEQWPYTALGTAAAWSPVHIVRYLLDEGAEVNEGDGHGSIALEAACHTGRLAAVELLLGAGADAALRTRGYATPLMIAVDRGHVEAVRALLAHGCGDIDARSRGNGGTALGDACANWKGATLRLLLEAGADWTIANIHGQSALTLAIEGGQDECVAVLKVSKERRADGAAMPAHTAHLPTPIARACPAPRLPQTSPLSTSRAITPRHQAHQSAYLLAKARRLRDATLMLSQAAAAQAAVMPSPPAVQEPPVYLAQRVGTGGTAPEVGVRGLSPASRSAGPRQLLVEEAVVRHWVEGMRGELVRELMEM